ncbi:MAG TPA: class I SAM-dependent methyltransferase [Thermohalobaculum sp.]|nr:class I SAM-dependent methyltransferase [Thermohalobaculum sp.]
MAEVFEWAGAMGREWARNQAALDRQLAPAGDAGLRALAPRAGERVLDLGCGAGATTAGIVGAVGPRGAVTAIDISPDLLALARARPGCEGVTFIEGDAAAAPLPEAAFDALFSRFGCMFFAEPVPAFANLRRAMRPGGRAVLVAWREMALNPWAAIPAAAGAELLGPAESVAPGTPGPFAWAEPEVFRPILENAGFTGVAWQEEKITLTIGEAGEAEPAARAAAVLTRIGPLARRLRGQPDPLREAACQRLKPLLAPFVRDGWVRMPASIWLIRARA